MPHIVGINDTHLNKSWSDLSSKQKEKLKAEYGSDAKSTFKQAKQSYNGGGGTSNSSSRSSGFVPVNGGFTQNDLSSMLGAYSNPPSGQGPTSSHTSTNEGSEDEGSEDEVPVNNGPTWEEEQAASIAQQEAQHAHEAAMQAAELKQMLALQKDAQLHAERMNAKDRAANYMNSNINKSVGKWQGQDFTGGAASMGQRQFAERMRGEIHKVYKFD